MDLVNLARIKGGFVQMRENRIERAHQDREKYWQRLSCLHNISKAKSSQAQFEHLRKMEEIKTVQAEVVEKAKRQNVKR